jgi:Ca-activated chloride channel homolog
LFFANLTLVEFLVLLGGVSAVTAALYLLDRSRRKVVVSTLRFWIGSDRPMESTQRRRIRQWASLLMQLVSMLLILLALAQLRWGSRDESSLDHVLLLDTSSWMAAQSGGRSLMDAAREQALAYLDALPSNDRVMVVYADALATPASSFETNRREVTTAIRRARPGASALNFEQAIAFARQAQRISARRAGEIVFAGAGRIGEHERETAAVPPANFRLLPVEARLENTGLRKVGVVRSPADPELWQILAVVRNYGFRPQPVDIALRFGGAPVGVRQFTLPAGTEREVSFELRTRAAGLLETRLRAAEDAFPGDDTAVLELPAGRKLRVAVCTDQPARMRPLIASHPQVQETYFSPAQCGPSMEADLAVLDGVVPAGALPVPTVYLDPPSERSPVRVLTILRDVQLENWRTDHPVGAGLRTKDLRLSEAHAMAPAAGDGVVAESGGHALVVARTEPGGRRIVVFGFHPMQSAMRYTLAAPLLFANILHWMAGDAFRRSEVYAGTVGAVDAVLASGMNPERVSVVDERNEPVPFTVEGERVRFFGGEPGQVRVLSDDQEQVYSLSLPDVATASWEAPEQTRRGVPLARQSVLPWSDLWPWLAALGALGLWLEWMLFSGDRRPRLFRFPRRRPAAGNLRRAS